MVYKSPEIEMLQIWFLHYPTKHFDLFKIFPKILMFIYEMYL